MSRLTSVVIFKADEAECCNLLVTMQAEIIDNLFEDLEEIAPDDGDGITNWLGTLGTTDAGVTSTLSIENSAISSRNSANTKPILKRFIEAIFRKSQKRV